MKSTFVLGYLTVKASREFCCCKFADLIQSENDISVEVICRQL